MSRTNFGRYSRRSMTFKYTTIFSVYSDLSFIFFFPELINDVSFPGLLSNHLFLYHCVSWLSWSLRVSLVSWLSRLCISLFYWTLHVTSLLFHWFKNLPSLFYSPFISFLAFPVAPLVFFSHCSLLILLFFTSTFQFTCTFHNVYLWSLCFIQRQTLSFF